MNKAELREIFKEKRSALSADFRAKADSAICRVLGEMDVMRRPGGVCAFVSDGTEPDLTAFLRKQLAGGVKVYFPVSVGETSGNEYKMAEATDLDKGLEKGRFGIKEPRPGSAILPEDEYGNMIWLIPGVAFDKAGRRLGRGRAVYDRVLRHGAGLTIGVFYEFQLCGSVPVEKHDFILDIIVTEAGLRKSTLKKQENKRVL
jgi:5-formyltetrahydrofolate cyclo-ligase